MSVAAVALGGVLLVGPWGSQLGTYARLWRDETRYQAIVQRALADPDAAFPRDVRVDPGPPVRVGFVWSGMVNHWKGVVFDPSDLLARRLPADGTSITLFEFDQMEWAEPLWGAWYYCGFR